MMKRDDEKKGAHGAREKSGNNFWRNNSLNNLWKWFVKKRVRILMFFVVRFCRRFVEWRTIRAFFHEWAMSERTSLLIGHLMDHGAILKSEFESNFESEFECDGNVSKSLESVYFHWTVESAYFHCHGTWINITVTSLNKFHHPWIPEKQNHPIFSDTVSEIIQFFKLHRNLTNSLWNFI